MQDTRVESPYDDQIDTDGSDGMATTTEELISTALAEQLRIPVSAEIVNMPFFDMGLDSLGLVRMVALLEDKLGRPIDPLLALDHPSVARLAAYLDAHPPAASS